LASSASDGRQPSRVLQRHWHVDGQIWCDLTSQWSPTTGFLTHARPCLSPASERPLDFVLVAASDRGRLLRLRLSASWRRVVSWGRLGRGHRAPPGARSSTTSRACSARMSQTKRCSWRSRSFCSCPSDRGPSGRGKNAAGTRFAAASVTQGTPPRRTASAVASRGVLGVLVFPPPPPAVVAAHAGVDERAGLAGAIGRDSSIVRSSPVLARPCRPRPSGRDRAVAKAVPRMFPPPRPRLKRPGGGASGSPTNAVLAGGVRRVSVSASVAQYPRSFLRPDPSGGNRVRRLAANPRRHHCPRVGGWRIRRTRGRQRMTGPRLSGHRGGVRPRTGPCVPASFATSACSRVFADGW